MHNLYWQLMTNGFMLIKLCVMRCRFSVKRKSFRDNKYSNMQYDFPLIFLNIVVRKGKHTYFYVFEL